MAVQSDCFQVKAKKGKGEGSAIHPTSRLKTIGENGQPTTKLTKVMRDTAG